MAVDVRLCEEDDLVVDALSVLESSTFFGLVVVGGGRFMGIAMTNAHV